MVEVKVNRAKLVQSIDITISSKEEFTSALFKSVYGGQDENCPVEVIIHSKVITAKDVKKLFHDDANEYLLFDSGAYEFSGPSDIKKSANKISFTLSWGND